ncbi:MAG TPA: dual specificity protein phosphatase family protein [Candidatus Saccharimonadales bacterium]|nr:dual specificity protein phosphatase family protein [Candidatus Saccharimonadales bacterium]
MFAYAGQVFAELHGGGNIDKAKLRNYSWRGVLRVNVGTRKLLWWVIPGVLAGMPMPFIHPERRLNGGGELYSSVDELPILYEAGIRAIVSLLSFTGDKTIFSQAGFSHLSLPIPDGYAPSLDQAQAFLQFVREQRSQGRPVAVHCAAGRGRTGTMLAAYFIAEGASWMEAIARVRGVEPSAIETSSQVRFLEEYDGWSAAKRSVSPRVSPQ